MKRDRDVTIVCYLSPRERAAADDMKRLAGLASDANLLRTALYRFAVHLDHAADPALFQVRGQSAHAFDCDQLEECMCHDGKRKQRASS